MANKTKMKNSVIMVYAIILAVYVLAFLIIPFNKVAASWISFAFTIFALISSLAICGFAFNKGEKLVSKIYGLPVFKIGVFYAVAQFVLGVVICVIAAFVAIPYWIVLLLSVILLAGSAIGLIVVDNVRVIVESMDEEVKQATRNLTVFKVNIVGILDVCTNAEVKPDLQKLNELFKYSDPVSSEATQPHEQAINTMLIELRNIVENGSTEDVKALITKITNALNDRNRVCKATK